MPLTNNPEAKRAPERKAARGREGGREAFVGSLKKRRMRERRRMVQKREGKREGKMEEVRGERTKPYVHPTDCD